MLVGYFQIKFIVYLLTSNPAEMQRLQIPQDVLEQEYSVLAHLASSILLGY